MVIGLILIKIILNLLNLSVIKWNSHNKNDFNINKDLVRKILKKVNIKQFGKFYPCTPYKSLLSHGV